MISFFKRKNIFYDDETLSFSKTRNFILPEYFYIILSYINILLFRLEKKSKKKTKKKKHVN